MPFNRDSRVVSSNIIFFQFFMQRENLGIATSDQKFAKQIVANPIDIVECMLTRLIAT